MRAAIPMLGTLEASESTGFSNVSHFAGQNGTVIRRPRWRARASEMRRAGKARPRTWFTLGGTPRLSRRYWGAPPPCPPFVHVVPRAKRSNARSAMGKAIRHRDDHLRHAETRKRQFAPTTTAKAVFSLESEGFLFDKTKRNLSVLGRRGLPLLKLRRRGRGRGG